MRSLPWRPLAVASLLFLCLAPATRDTYNTLVNRTFLDLFRQGNAYVLAPGVTTTFRGQTLPLDWGYPPLAVGLVAPAWLAYQVTGSDALYQLLFKLPLFLGVAAAAVLLARLAPARPSLPWVLLLNPATILLVDVSGGFDACVAGLLTAAYYWLAARPRPTRSAVCLGVAVGLRLYPAIGLPVVALWLWRRHGLAATGRYVVLTLGVAGVLLSPALLNLERYVTTSASTLAFTGPFSLAAIAATLGAALGDSAAPEQAYRLSMAATALGLLAGYVALARQRTDLLSGLLAAYLLFYGLYPRMHGLYTLAVYPLALLVGTSLARWVWLPGFLWFATFNGVYGATGLLYFLAPLTGTWADQYQALGLPVVGRFVAQAALMLAHAGLCLTSAWRLMRPAPDPASTPSPVPHPRRRAAAVAASNSTASRK